MRKRHQPWRRIREPQPHAANRGRRSPDQEHTERRAIGARKTRKIDRNVGIPREQLAGTRDRVGRIRKTNFARNTHARSIRALDVKRRRCAAHLLPFCSCSMFSSVFSPCVSSRVMSASSPDFAISAPTWFR